MRRWSNVAEENLIDAVEARWSYVRIAKAQRRSLHAVRGKAGELGVTVLQAGAQTALAQATRLGVHRSTMKRWLARGWIRGHVLNRITVIDDDDVIAFLDQADLWHEWEPSAIRDAGLREYCQELRAGVTFWTLGQAAASIPISREALVQRTRRGLLRFVQASCGRVFTTPSWVAASEERITVRPPYRHRLFTADEEEFLRAWRPYQSLGHLGKALERDESTVSRFCIRKGIGGCPGEETTDPPRAMAGPEERT